MHQSLFISIKKLLKLWFYNKSVFGFNRILYTVIIMNYYSNSFFLFLITVGYWDTKWWIGWPSLPLGYICCLYKCACIWPMFLESSRIGSGHPFFIPVFLLFLVTWFLLPIIFMYPLSVDTKLYLNMLCLPDVLITIHGHVIYCFYWFKIFTSMDFIVTTISLVEISVQTSSPTETHSPSDLWNSCWDLIVGRQSG